MTTTQQPEIVPVTDERQLIEAVINAYHTTRLGSDYVPHILRKSSVQRALARIRSTTPVNAGEVIEACARVADAERDYRRECQAKAIKKSEARDFESMAIACVHVAAAIRAIDPATFGAGMREASLLRDIRDWLDSDQMGPWPYMESSGFYDDKEKMIARIDAALTPPPAPVIGEG